MQALPLRAIITAVGAALALMAAAVIGLYVFRDRAPKSAPAASGLQIVQGAADSRTAATKPLRCFVNGQFVGMATVADCAQKNGVAAQALDVGLDPATGAVEGAGNSLAPPVQAPAPTTPAPTADAQADAAPTPAPPAVAECLRYGPEGWRGAGSDLSLGQCARALFDGRCSRPGEALYGRWGSQTLRLVPGRVDISPDNRNFRPLAPQNPDDCSLPAG
jgi:hypothetical protein